jgi:hypothetical protein
VLAFARANVACAPTMVRSVLPLVREIVALCFR